MLINKPIRRHNALKPVSRDHHQGLLLCWKIRTGFSRSIETSRIKNYADWFFEVHLLPHFEIEEKHMFPVLGGQNGLVKKALAEHRRLKRLFTSKDEIVRSLSLIEEELEAHIRFEERVLFNEIQNLASEEEMMLIEAAHQMPQVEGVWKVEFWLK